MSEQIDNQIIHCWQGGQSLRAIARELGISRWRVARTIGRYQAARTDDESTLVASALPSPPGHRASKLDDFDVTIQRLLERYPQITVTRIFQELKPLGYTGSYTILRERVKRMRGRPAKPLVTRFETAPGVQAQMDWAEYRLDFTQEGRRKVYLFSYLLGYSRRQYLCFTEQQDFEATISQHVRAFHHLHGLAATCLYDNMKVAVTRWEDDQPIYNSRFLAFATHYGYRPWACRQRRPQTKGKVERPFDYVEKSLLNGRTFRSLEHLNEVTRWWLANVADVRKHGTTSKRPLDAHAEELPYLLPMPQRDYDTAKVVYRVVDVEGTIRYGNNHYSAPWELVGQLLPVRVTEAELIVYNRRIQEVGRHLLLLGQTGNRRTDPQHRPPKDQEKQLAILRERFSELGETPSRFLEGLLLKQRCGKHQAGKVLALLRAYHHEDVLAAMARAIRYHAYSLSSLERILAAQAIPKPSWQTLDEEQQRMLQELTDEEAVQPRSSTEYQHLLFDESAENDPSQRLDDSEANPGTLGDIKDSVDK